MNPDQSTLVNPRSAAERALAAMSSGDTAEAIRELAHGLASLTRQHNELAAVSKASAATGEVAGTGTGVWYCPVCGYIDPLTKDTHCPKQHPAYLKRPMFVEANFGYFVRIGLQEGEEC